MPDLFVYAGQVTPADIQVCNPLKLCSDTTSAGTRFFLALLGVG